MSKLAAICHKNKYLFCAFLNMDKTRFRVYRPKHRNFLKMKTFHSLKK